jgi:hypothetical protein
MDVDSSSVCNFALTPGYVTSVQGDAGHWQLVGVNSVYSATKNGFRVYVWHPQLRGSYLQYFAKRYNWRINWVADASQKAGVTKPGKSGWKQFAKDTVYVDVDTTGCKYTDTPSVVTALHGARDHWRTQGVHSIYRATKTGFRVYVSHANVKLTAAMAEEYKWAVASTWLLSLRWIRRWCSRIKRLSWKRKLHKGHAAGRASRWTASWCLRASSVL